MESTDRIEMLNDLIEAGKTYEFIEDEIIKIADYRTGKNKIYINLIGLIETMCETMSDEDIKRILLTDEEIKERGL